MDKMLITGLTVGGGLITYKAAIYIHAYFKIKKEKKQKVVNLGTYSEYKKKLERGKIK